MIPLLALLHWMTVLPILKFGSDCIDEAFKQIGISGLSDPGMGSLPDQQPAVIGY
jgi:hypothetical protein